MKLTKIATLLSACAALSATPALTETMSLASGWPPGTKPNLSFDAYAAKVDELTKGAFQVKVYPLSLLSFGESHAGLKDGLADLAVVTTPYFAAEYPYLNMLQEFSSMAEQGAAAGDKNSLAFAGAFSELVMLNCPACQAEATAQNQVFMGSGMTTSYALQCTSELATPDDVKGKRIRVGGAYWARWVEEMQAVPVSMSVNETFEALSQNVLDCTAHNLADMVNFSFVDVVKHVYTDIPGGQFGTPLLMNRDRWSSLDDATKRSILTANATFAAQMTWIYFEESKAARSVGADKGVDVKPAGSEVMEKSQAFITSDLGNVVTNYQGKFAIEGGEGLRAKMSELLEKWSGLTKDVDSAEALAAIYDSEIYSKVDVASYGQ